MATSLGAATLLAAAVGPRMRPRPQPDNTPPDRAFGPLASIVRHA